MDFSQVDMNEELYDPDVQVVRSRQNLVETFNRAGGPGEISSVNPVITAGRRTQRIRKPMKKVKNRMKPSTMNSIERYAEPIKPIGSLRRLSVATVLDGTYTMETNEAGQKIRKYNPRSDEELNQFRNIVQNAMGYSEDREDQITVESFPFAHVEDFSQEAFDWKSFLRQYGRSFTNSILDTSIVCFGCIASYENHERNQSQGCGSASITGGTKSTPCQR